MMVIVPSSAPGAGSAGTATALPGGGVHPRSKTMARVDIKLPEHLPFRTEIELYLLHMNYGGHLDNALLLTVVTEARMRFFRALGFKESDVCGVGIVIADAAVQYRSEAFQGEVMEVAMAADEFSRCGCDLVWRMTERTTQREVARGKTGIVFFDYRQRKVAPLPEEFRTRAQACAQPATAAPG